MDIEEKLPLGALNNYVDKMRGEEGQKMSVFVNAQGIKIRRGKNQHPSKENALNAWEKKL